MDAIPSPLGLSHPEVGPAEAARALQGSGPTIFRSAHPPALARRAVCLLALCAADIGAVFAAQALAQLAVAGLGLPPVEAPAYLAAFSVFAFLAVGLYAEWGLGPVERLRLRAMGAFLFGLGATAALSAERHMFDVALAAQVLLWGALVVPLGFYAGEAVRMVLIRLRCWGTPTALIGTGPESCTLGRALLARPEYGLVPVGFIEIARQADPASDCTDLPLPLIGREQDVERLSRDIDVVLIAGTETSSSRELLRLPFRHVVLARAAMDGPSSCLRLRALCDGFGFDLPRGIFRRRNLFIKRCLDRSLAIPLLLVLAPLMGVVALAIRIVSPGPVFFRHGRVGMDGRPIEVLKFRTMHVDAEARLQEHLARDPDARRQWETFFKLTDDPRIIPGIGRILRRFSLDELPQLINVLRGEISLVGPRPFPAYHLQGFDEEFRRLRASVPPGLTGFWQISARSEGDLATQKAQDSFYIQNWSVWLDLYILLRTPLAVVAARGAC
ncbi:sugar transferase [Enterovirga aerilata]|uniref:Sugar transferase n=1 Tax=Enterovirga aerilata TaxID=2730920 RepID=A0A849I9M2_9HYPH|nr:sugar transferase [Enterovirga sp. DB1703]NNM74088.1 sugar transferase [Enterovirga sp. DB1703]